MRMLVNDEIGIPAEAMKDRCPTEKLRLREIDGTRMLLEQLWRSPFVGSKGEWVPVPFLAMPREKKLNTHEPVKISRPREEGR
jgi:hypothetical protein